MINIDTRLFDDVSCDQFWLLCHIVKRADVNLACYPSNKTLCVDTGWNIKKLQRIKTELIERGLLVIKPRIGKEEKQASNWYSIRTDLMGVYVPAKSLGVNLQDTPKRDTLSANGVRPPTPKRDNEVLTNSEVLNFTESNDSVSKKPIDSNALELSIKPNKNAAAVDFPEYSKFIDVWVKQYKTVGIKMPRDGAKVKSIIKTTREQIALRGVTPSTENTIEFWEIFVANLHKTWGHGKDLPTIDSKYTSLIFELENGRKQTFNSKNSADRFSDFAR